jgi:hypothetical protein
VSLKSIYDTAIQLLGTMIMMDGLETGDGFSRTETKTKKKLKKNFLTSDILSVR